MKKPIAFTKMEGAGNDFVVLDNRRMGYSLEELIELAPELCHRRLGIGADGLLALHPPEKEETDYAMVYRNADGSDAGMCGNGARCLALFAHDHGMDRELTFTVHGFMYRARVLDGTTVRVSFPQHTKVHKIPSERFEPLFGVFTGTPHVVVPLTKDSLENTELLENEGKRLRHHQNFRPEGTNVNFIRAIGEQALELRTFEKGVEGLTLACGTGAIAAALVRHHQQARGPGHYRFRVEAPGGTLFVEFDFNDAEEYFSLTLEGPAHFVFNGTYDR